MEDKYLAAIIISFFLMVALGIKHVETTNQIKATVELAKINGCKRVNN